MKGEKDIRKKLLEMQGLLERPGGAMHIEKAMYWRECLEWVLEVDHIGKTPVDRGVDSKPFYSYELSDT